MALHVKRGLFQNFENKTPKSPMALTLKVPLSLALNYNVEQAFFFSVEKAVTIVCVCKRHH